MKRAIKLSSLILILIMMLPVGCTAEEPGHVIINDDTPVSVSVSGNPEIKIVDSNGDIINIDALSMAITVVDFAHQQGHAGHSFTILEVVDLGNGGVRDILIRAANSDKLAHLVWEIEHELETSITFYRDTTTTDNGTLIASFNRNGNSTNTAETLVSHTPTISDVGTLIGIIQQGNGKKAGGSDRESNEFILKINTTYLIRITNLTANNNLIFTKINWYEHVSGS